MNDWFVTTFLVVWLSVCPCSAVVLPAFRLLVSVASEAWNVSVWSNGDKTQSVIAMFCSMVRCSAVWLRRTYLLWLVVLQPFGCAAFATWLVAHELVEESMVFITHKGFCEWVRIVVLGVDLADGNDRVGLVFTHEVVCKCDCLLVQSTPRVGGIQYHAHVVNIDWSSF